MEEQSQQQQQEQVPDEEQTFTFDQRPSFLLRKRKNIWVEGPEILRDKKPAPVRRSSVERIEDEPKEANVSPQQVCGFCGSTFFSLEELNSHKAECRVVTEERKPKTLFSMVPASLVDQAERLPDFWNLVLQSLDMYQVHADDLPLRRRGKTKVVEGSVGIRCTHCAARNMMGSGSMYFPGNIGILSAIIYKISDTHLLQSCPCIPKSIQSRIRAFKPHATAQMAMVGRIALPNYLREFVDLYELVNASGGKGIRRYAALPDDAKDNS